MGRGQGGRARVHAPAGTSLVTTTAALVMESSPEVDMNTRFVSRAIPSVLVIALLALAAPAPPGAGPAPPPQLQPPCTEFASAVAGDSTFAVLDGTGFEQALPAGMSVSACSLRVIVYPNAFGKLELRDWDPATLAPDPDAIALRRTFFDGSSLIWTNGGMAPLRSFVPPVVTNSVPGVAEPPKPGVAMQFFG